MHFKHLASFSFVLLSAFGCSLVTDFDSLQEGNSGGLGGSSSGGSTTSGGTGTGANDGLGGSIEEVPLANASFETGDLTGWTVDPATAIDSSYLFVQWPTGTVLPPDGSYQLSYWHGTDAYTVTLSQTVTGLADGTYRLEAFFSHGADLTAELIATDCGGADVSKEIPVTDPSSFTLYRLSDIVVVGGSCTIRLRVEAIANAWLNVDDFALFQQ